MSNEYIFKKDYIDFENNVAYKRGAACSKRIIDYDGIFGFFDKDGNYINFSNSLPTEYLKIKRCSSRTP